MYRCRVLNIDNNTQQNKKVQYRKKSAGKSSGVVVTERDQKAIELLLEMKFGSLDFLWKMVWDNNDQSKSNKYAWERLGKLEKAGLIKSEKVLGNLQNYYFPTNKGARFIEAKSSGNFPKPIRRIDYRYFEHDEKVGWSRYFLEKAGLAKSWVSERSLQSKRLSESGLIGKDALSYLLTQRLPDAEFLFKGKERIAFEYENSFKSKSRYEEKIQEYLNHFHNGAYAGVLFVTNNQRVFKVLLEITKEFDQRFKIKKYEEIVK